MMPGAQIVTRPERTLNEDELSLVRVCLALGAADFGGPLSAQEEKIAAQAALVPLVNRAVDHVRDKVGRGEDPLGELFLSARTPESRRSVGAFYTPDAIVAPMVKWLAGAKPDLWVDAGCGSGRFSAAAARISPESTILAVDSDPIATVMTRAHLRLVGAKRVRVIHGDYMRLQGVFPHEGRIAFVGNPPYVRHHDLAPAQKAWAHAAARRLGMSISGLAGLHVHFFLATALYMRPGDIGCFVTSAEWLDVGYGEFLRRLLVEKLGLVSLHLVEDSATPFLDAMTTALVTCFGAGATRSVRLQKVPRSLQFGSLSAVGTPVSITALAREPRWSGLFERQPKAARPSASIRLGSLVRVHRGVATGANEFFVLKKQEAADRGLMAFCRPVLTRAEQVITSGGIIKHDSIQDYILDLPSVLPDSAETVRAYLAEGESRGIAARYLCAHRKPWWRLGLKEPPPIVVTYMARQAPVFALNQARASVLNVLHGLYPTTPMTEEELRLLVEYLNVHREEFRGLGRTYHGGLEKFEPREVESLPIASLDILEKVGKGDPEDEWYPRLFPDLD